MRVFWAQPLRSTRVILTTRDAAVFARHLKSDKMTTWYLYFFLNSYFLFQVVPGAVNAWQLALNVKRARGPIKLNRKCMNNQYFLVDEDPGEQVKIYNLNHFTTSKLSFLHPFIVSSVQSQFRKNVDSWNINKSCPKHF